jgi:hypothetical protein
LVGHILRSNPEAQKYLEENFQFGMLNYERTGELSPEIMGDIISRFWREHPQATKEMVERSKRYNDPFLLEE